MTAATPGAKPDRRKRDRVAEGRYEHSAEELHKLQALRRSIAFHLREAGYGWQQIGDHLGISPNAARLLAVRFHAESQSEGSEE